MTEAYPLSNYQQGLLVQLMEYIRQRESKVKTPVTTETGFFYGSHHARALFWLGLESGIPIPVMLETELNLLKLERRKLLLNGDIRAGEIMIPIEEYELAELRMRYLQ